MSSVVAAVATVHAPFITGLPGLAPEGQRSAVYRGFALLRERLAVARPDVVVVLSSEHITNILSTNVPPFCVGIGGSHACLGEFNLPESMVPGDPKFADALVRYAYENGFDVAHASELSLDHGVGLPLYFLRPEYDLPVVPVLQNTIWAPMHTASRAFEFGRLLRSFIDQDRSGRRVALVAAGGISHWVGNARHGDLNVEFDEWFIRCVLENDLEALRWMTQTQIDEGGDGANEIRSWISLAAAMRDCRVESIVEESFIPGWNVGGYQLAWDVAGAGGSSVRAAGVDAAVAGGVEHVGA
jgi:aromatic ring-opening dioxygenase catalytic subunit (LigB family)